MRSEKQETSAPQVDNPPSEMAMHPNRRHYHKQEFCGRPALDLAHTKPSCSLLSHLNREIKIKGLFNLAVIIVVVQNARLILENFIKYGIRIRFLSFPKDVQDLIGNWPVLLSLICMHLFFFQAFLIEKYLNPLLCSTGSSSLPAIGHLFSSLNAFMILYIPYASVKYSATESTYATLLLSFSITWFLKLISFHAVITDVRDCIAHGEVFEGILGADQIRTYPGSLSLKHFYVYLVMPTMCFQFEYPRNPRISWLVAVKHIIELIGCLVLSIIIVQQYITIILENTFSRLADPMSKLQLLLHLAERLMKLSIPNLVVWLLLFMAIFHHWLNFLAEITRFADRRFYDDWWNSENIGEYWRKWNLPIHNFVVKHIYYPLIIRQRVSKFWASQLVFLLSALGHEYLVCVPLHLKFTGIVFSGFLMQVPLTALTSNSVFQKRRTLGNVAFWTLFCFTGQPLAIMIYYNLWGIKNGFISAPDWLYAYFGSSPESFK